MKVLGFGRHALTSCAPQATLAGCGWLAAADQRAGCGFCDAKKGHGRRLFVRL